MARGRLGEAVRGRPPEIIRCTRGFGLDPPPMPRDHLCAEVAAAERALQTAERHRAEAAARLAAAGSFAQTEHEAGAERRAAHEGWRLAAGQAALARDALRLALERLAATEERDEAG